MFRINEYSQRIRDDYKKGGLFEGLIRKYLMDNTHRVKLVAIPDQEVGPKEEKEEQEKLDRTRKRMDEQQKQKVIHDALLLRKHQEQLQDYNVLPTLQLEDISRQIEYIDSERKHIGNIKTWWFE